MATVLQIEANRRNAQKSTGPKTPEGKAAVRLNALKHGLRARTVVLPSENADEFHHLCDDLEAEWQPQSRSEQFYVEQMAVSQWKLNRMEIGEVNVFTNETRAQTQLPMLDRLWQAQCRLERSYARAQRDLERLQQSRRKQAQQPRRSRPLSLLPRWDRRFRLSNRLLPHLPSNQHPTSKIQHPIVTQQPSQR
jgi:ribosomal silencing factor RsfS